MEFKTKKANTKAIKDIDRLRTQSILKMEEISNSYLKKTQTTDSRTSNKKKKKSGLR